MKVLAFIAWTALVAGVSAREGAIQQSSHQPPMRAVIYEFRAPTLQVSGTECRQICTARDKQRKDNLVQSNPKGK